MVSREESPLSIQALGQAMRLRGFCEHRTKSLRFWDGIRLLPSETEGLETLPTDAEKIPDEKSSAAIPNDVPQLEPQRAHLGARFPRTDAVTLTLLRAMGDPFPEHIPRQVLKANPLV